MYQSTIKADIRSKINKATDVPLHNVLKTEARIFFDFILTCQNQTVKRFQ